MSQTDYVASVGNDDKERLAIQHESFANGTEEFLNRLGITEGMNILVMGCGGGDETAMLAKMVGEKGRVTAIDISPEQIKISQEKINKESLTNVTFKVLAAENLSALSDKFDVAYCRMVLVHIANPTMVLKLMSECIVENGIVACEEPDISSCFSIPKSEAFEKHISMLCEFMKKRNCDPDLGSKTFRIFNEIGFSDIDVSFYQPAITDKRLQLAAPMSSKSCMPQYISLGLTSEAEANKMIYQIEKDIVEQDNTLLGQCRMTQIYGRK